VCWSLWGSGGAFGVKRGTDTVRGHWLEVYLVGISGYASLCATAG
jgi:hypothetical protein